MIDALTKLANFIPCKESMDAEELSQLYLGEIWKHPGDSNSAISDHGATFTSEFFTSFLKQLGTTPRATTAYHPQADGQTERTNQTLEDFLRCFVSYQQEDWSDWLPLAKFTYNNHTLSSSRVSPFFATYGFHPLAEPTLMAQARFRQPTNVSANLGPFGPKCKPNSSTTNKTIPHSTTSTLKNIRTPSSQGLSSGSVVATSRLSARPTSSTTGNSARSRSSKPEALVPSDSTSQHQCHDSIQSSTCRF